MMLSGGETRWPRFFFVRHSNLIFNILLFCRVSLPNCHFCVNMSANNISVEELRATFDEKLAPLKVLIVAIILLFVTSILLFGSSYSNTF